MRHKF